MIIDTHCHYNLAPIWNDQQPENWKEHWRKATESGVIGSMVVGVDADTSSLAVSLAQTDSRLLAAVG
ncbi:hypothetical protein KBC79_05845, partial [Candidatus Woesebacteria bacterium]|nr:hypothetical protein [Candidatus Woesebacteria bacterium]